MMFSSGGFMLTGIFAYFIHDWRQLQMGLTIPGAFFLVYWWVMPESARWLLANNRKKSAVHQIQRIASSNQVGLPQEFLDEIVEVEAESSEDSASISLLELFMSPDMRTKALVIFFDWFVISEAYYGLSWSTGSSLSGDPVLNHVLSGAVEVFGYIFLLFTLDRFSRRKILAGNLVFAGMALLFSLIVPQDETWLVITLTMMAKMSVTASYGTIYLFSIEQFPAAVRNVALGAASVAAKIGGVSAPYLIYMSKYWHPLPILIFGSTALLGGLLTTLLPEAINPEMILETPESMHFF